MYDCVFATEPVVVSFSVRNPLAIPLQMCNVTAVWEYTPLTAGVGIVQLAPTVCKY